MTRDERSDAVEDGSNGASPHAGGSSAGDSGGADAGAKPGVMTRLGPVGLLGAVAAFLPAIGGLVLLSQVSAVGPVLAGEGSVPLALGMVLYIVAFALLSGLAILPTYAQAVLGGWAFGFGGGLPAAMLGILGGAVTGYEIGHWVSGNRATSIINENPRWRAVRDALLGSERRGEFWRSLGIVTLVRLNSPFSLTNLAMASVKVRRSAYALGTVAGLLPRTAVTVWLATSIEGTLNDESIQAARKGWMVVASIIVFLLIFSVIGFIANQAMAKVTQVEDAGSGVE